MSTTNPTPDAPNLAPNAPHPTPDALDRFFTWCRSLGVTRSADDRWGAGVCSGIAYRLGVDPLLIRAAFVVLACFAGIGITAYLVGWAFLPDARGELLAERAVRQGDAWAIVLLAVIGFSIFGGPVLASDNSGWAGGWWVLPIVIVGWVVLRRKRGESIIPSRTQAGPPPAVGTDGPYAAASGLPDPALAAPGAPTDQITTAPVEDPMSTLATPPAPALEGAGPAITEGAAAPPPTYTPRVVQGPPPPPRPRRRRAPHFTGLVTFGLAVAAYGLGVLLDGPTGFAGSGHLLGLILALGVVGLILLGLGIAGRRAGFAAVLAIVLGLSTTGAALTREVSWGEGIGDRTWRPSARLTAPSYSLSLGTGTLDLSQLPTEPTTPARITTGLGIGDLTIIVPPGLTVAVATSVGLGDITLDHDVVSQTSDAANGPSEARFDRVVGTGTPDVYVDAHVGIGSITITVLEGASA